MYSQRTIALKRYSTLSNLAQLLWCVAATALVVLLQLPTYSTLLLWLTLCALGAIRHGLPKARLLFDEAGAWYVQGHCEQAAELVYLNRFWLVIKLTNPQTPSRAKRLIKRLLTGHVLIFCDQFTPLEYRYARSRLSVAKFMNEPAPTNEF